MLVSVIIPVYNTEKYLKRCIQSVKEQTYTDVEIILIDDGSTDFSGVICDEFAKDDVRIKIIHKENEGLSSARNIGMEIAMGEYLAFLDSDDYFSTDCIRKMLEMCTQNDADIAIAKMMNITEYTNEELKFEQIEELQILSKEEAIEASLYQVLYSCTTPGKLYKKSVLDEIKFPVGRLSEDLATCHLILNNAKKVAYTNSYLYFYRQHSSSIMHVFNSRRVDALEWACRIESFCMSEYPSILTAAKCRTFNVAVHLILDLPNHSEFHDLYFKQIWNEVKRTRIQTIVNKKVRFREKAAAILSFGGEKLLRKIWTSGLAMKQTEI